MKIIIIFLAILFAASGTWFFYNSIYAIRYNLREPRSAKECMEKYRGTQTAFGKYCEWQGKKFEIEYPDYLKKYVN